MTKNRSEDLNKKSKKSHIEEFAVNVKSNYSKEMRLKITNPQMLKMVSEDNPLHDVIFDMLQWGYDDTYLTQKNARYLREIFTLLVALEAGKPFEDRVIVEES